MSRQSIYTLLVVITVTITLFVVPRFQANASATYNARTPSQLYSKYCVSCHGGNGRSQTSKGKFSHARDLTDSQWQDDVSDERIFNSIMNGRSVRGNMPAFSNKLNDKEAEALVGFVRGFRK
ncbi:MAG TPA: cytochrome c [Pyrinomonadaceae bacterium]|nr:cytochrome c [Pyrinomonadaceae bacterium]